MNNILMSANNLHKTYDRKGVPVKVLKGVSLNIHIGEALCIMGASGAGKSTLLHLLGTLDDPTEGSVQFRGRDLFKMNDDELSLFRNKTMGFVFQFHHLLPEFTALENVMMPLLISGGSRRDAARNAEHLLKELGLGHRLEHKPSMLSGGEQQRVAIARAVLRGPAVIFADEPTGNLDHTSGAQVQELLFELQRTHNLTLVVVTHDRDYARKFPRVIQLLDGKVV